MAGKGKAWETALWLEAEAAKRGGHQVSRCFSEAKEVSGRVIYSSQGPCDFLGFVLTRDGTPCPIAFDAKEIRGNRLAFKNIRGHQAMQMMKYASAGALSGVLARCSAGDFILPWRSFGLQYQEWASGFPGASASIEISESNAARIQPDLGWVFHLSLMG
jgi:penicillin-binding protein-related factor A (putative recombinase)